MTKELALQLIKSDLYEDLEEAWEMHFFQFKQELLRMPFASKLIRLKLKKIQQIQEIQALLFPTLVTSENSVVADKLENKTISEILQAQSTVKLRIHQAETPHQLKHLLIEYDFLALQYEQYIYLKLKEIEQKHLEVPYKNVADIMEIIRELQQLDDLKADEKKNLGKFEKKFPGLWYEFQRVKNHINQELIA